MKQNSKTKALTFLYFHQVFLWNISKPENISVQSLFLDQSFSIFVRALWSCLKLLSTSQIYFLCNCNHLSLLYASVTSATTSTNSEGQEITYIDLNNYIRFTS